MGAGVIIDSQPTTRPILLGESCEDLEIQAVSAAARTLPKERGAHRGLAEKESWN
jgi:hypothetical protein